MASNLDDKKGGAADLERASIEAESFGKGDILQLEHTDPVLNAKMHLVNNAIDEIGFTRYQMKLFVLNGFGYYSHLIWPHLPSISSNYPLHSHSTLTTHSYRL